MTSNIIFLHFMVCGEKIKLDSVSALCKCFLHSHYLDWQGFEPHCIQWLTPVTVVTSLSETNGIISWKEGGKPTSKQNRH